MLKEHRPGGRRRGMIFLHGFECSGLPLELWQGGLGWPTNLRTMGFMLENLLMAPGQESSKAHLCADSLWSTVVAKI